MASYWSVLGLPGEALTPAIEQLAQYAQWAFYGVQQGIMKPSGSVYFDPDWSDVLTGQWWRRPTNEDEILYNLAVFDSMKPAALQYAQNEAQKRQIYRLTVIVEGIRYILQTYKIDTLSPSYWSYWRSFIFGGTPPRPETAEMAEEARKAAAAAAAAARNGGLPTLAAFYEAQGAAVETVVEDSNRIWEQPGAMVQAFGVSLPMLALAFGVGLVAWKVLR